MAVYLEKRDVAATLAAWVYCAMWQLYAAKMTGRVGYIHWPRDPAKAIQTHFDSAVFDRLPNMFDWYFEQPTWREVSLPLCEEVWVWEQGVPELGVHHLMQQSLADIKAFYRENCRFSADVCARGKSLVAKRGVDFSNTIGVTWRGTDSVTDGRPYLSIETYFPFIDDILAERPGMCIVATAEEEGVLDPLLARYPQAVVLDEFVSVPRGSRLSPEWSGNLSGHERGMQPALMMWFFSKCAYYVKNRSNTGLVASWLSEGRSICLAHPENGGHEFDITKVEIDGKLGSLYR